MRYIKKATLRNAAIAFVSITMLVSLIMGLAAAASISGGHFEAEVTPGQHVSHEVNVTIEKDSSPTNFTAQITEYYKPEEGFYDGLTPGRDTNPYSARPFLKVSPTNITVTADKPGTFLIEGNIPSDVGDGERYALIHIESSPKFNEGIGSKIAFNKPIVLSIKGTKQIQSGQIIDIRVNQPISPSEQNITLIYLNTGNCRTEVLAKAYLKDKSGNILASASTELSGNIIPATTRQFELSLKPESNLKQGIFSMNASVNLEDGTILATKDISIDIKE